MDVAIVGAGISGLAAAYELQRRGARVTVYEAEGVGAGQSLGLARIFRVAHTRPELCALALEAREGWRTWERAFGLHLLGEEGLVVVGGEPQAAAMAAAGAPSEPLSRQGIEVRIPFLSPGHPWDGGILDPLAGAVRVRRTLGALAARVPVRRERVSDLDAVAGDAVLVCAGLGTQPLGFDFAMTDEPHVRVTYEAGASAACVIAPELYACPLGRTGRYGVGMHHQGEVPTMFDGLTPVGEVHCVSLFAPWLDASGDGFLALRDGRVTAFTGSNLMKFGPLLGDRLARSVFDGEIHPDLRPASKGAS